MSLLIGMLLAGHAAAAQPNCGDRNTQGDMNACALEDFHRADKALNAAWVSILAYVRSGEKSGRVKGDTRPSGEARLREAQRAWITYRDAHCAVEGYEARGGSMEPFLYNSCRAALTRGRTKQLLSIKTVVQN